MRLVLELWVLDVVLVRSSLTTDFSTFLEFLGEQAKAYEARVILLAFEILSSQPIISYTNTFYTALPFRNFSSLSNAPSAPDY